MSEERIKHIQKNGARIARKKKTNQWKMLKKYLHILICCVCYMPLVYSSTSSYMAMFPYTPRKEDELELRKGEMFLVLERCQDGWFKGTSMHTGKIGVFPGNYMSPVSRSAIN